MMRVLRLFKARCMRSLVMAAGLVGCGGGAVDGVITKAVPERLSLAVNDLDFYQLPDATSTHDTAYNDLRVTVDASQFFGQGGDHLVFALDLQGGQGSGNPHCGPIVRHDANLWATARGFILRANGQVQAELWNGTAAPGIVDVVNQSGAIFDPAATPVFTVRIRAGYQRGPWAQRMHIAIFAGDSIYGPKVFEGQSIGWLWDWSGTHRAAIGAIAMGFVAPAQTGCVEQLAPRSAPGAVVPFNHLELRIF